VKSIPAQKLPRQRKSAHFCDITLLEENSPLLFHVINTSFNSNYALEYAK